MCVYVLNIYTYTRVMYVRIYMYVYVAGCIPTTQEEEKLLLGHGNTSGLETGTYVSSFVYVSVSSADNAAAVHHVCQHIRSFIYLAHVYSIQYIICGSTCIYT